MRSGLGLRDNGWFDRGNKGLADKMPMFHFTATVDTTVVRDRERYEYPSLEFAKVEGRSVLSPLVQDRFPPGTWEMASVEIYDERPEPLTELRLSFQEIEK